MIMYLLYIFILTAQVSQDSDARRELLKAYFAEESEEAWFCTRWSHVWFRT